MTALLTSGLDRSAPDLPPGASPRLHDLARWVGSWCFRPALRVRVHHGDRIPAGGAPLKEYWTGRPVTRRGSVVDVGPLPRHAARVLRLEA